MPRSTRFRRILCPVDFSACSRGALRYAVALAQRTRGSVTILFVNDPLLATAAAAAAYDVKKLNQETAGELRRFVRRALGDRQHGFAVSMAFGNPATEILKTARKTGADLIVMGSRGVTAPAKWFAGSTTEHVLRRTTVPVLVVPGAGRQTRAVLAAGSGRRTARAIVPVDIQDASRADVRASIAASRGLGVTPVFVHAVPLSALPPWLRSEQARLDRERFDAARSALAKLTGARSRLEIAAGAPAETIANATGRLKAAIIIMTLRHASGLFKPRQGVVTYQVVCRATVPVLALPSPAAD